MRLAHPRAWQSRAASVRLAAGVLQVFGAAWLLFEPLALWKPDTLDWGFQGYGWLLLFSVVIATLWKWPRTTISRRVSMSDTRITVGVSDVLSQEGNVIIGVTDVFDTEIGEVISPQSVQGQFQTRLFPNTAELDDKISASLASLTPEIDPAKIRGKNARYPIGTVAVIRRGESRYFLSAYSRMNSDVQAQSDICKLSASLEACWRTIRAAGQHEPVHMPVIGSRFARTGLPRSLLIQFIVLSFLDEERKSSVTEHLHVHVAAQDADHVDFVVLENWLADLTRAV